MYYENSSMSMMMSSGYFPEDDKQGLPGREGLMKDAFRLHCVNVGSEVLGA